MFTPRQKKKIKNAVEFIVVMLFMVGMCVDWVGLMENLGILF